MIATTITGLAIAAAAFVALPGSAYADTPVEPIDAAQVALVITSGDPLVDGACDGYADSIGAAFALAGILDDVTLATDVLIPMIDAFVIITVEGDEIRLSPEARDVLVDWLHDDCTGVGV
jgi:hypothetical protein